MSLKNKITIETAAILLLLFSSCSTSSTKVNDAPITQIKVDVKQQDAYEHFFKKEYKAIPLETSDSFLIGKISKIQLINNCIYVFDKEQKKIYAFDAKGFFIREYCHIGQGEGEYPYLSDFEVYNKHLYLLSRANKCIFQYTLDDQFVKKINLNEWYEAFHFLDEKRVLLYSNKSNNVLYNIVEFNCQQKQVENKYFPFKRNENFSLYYPVFHEASDNELLLIQPYDYSVYTMQEKGPQILCTFFFNTVDKIPDDMDNIPLNQLHTMLRGKSVIKSFDWITRKDSILYASYILDYRPYLIRVNLNTNTTYNTILEDSEEYPFAFLTPSIYWQGNIVSICDAVDVLMFTETSFPSDKNPDGLLHEDDNPVIFIRELK